MTVNCDSQSGRLRHDWQWKHRADLPLGCSWFSHNYTHWQDCVPQTGKQLSKKRTQQQRGQICLTGKNKGAGDADSIHLYWCQNALICQMIHVSSNECWMTITMDCLDNYSKYVIQKAEPIRVLCCYMTDLLSWLSSSNQHTFSMVAPGYIMV